ncbi:MAG: helix-turn-helix transcriptional regulator [Bordetella sp.]|uniref:helix-turn-helix transcriptional regulator n=1 Tax=Bordetella sp. TaxID=28081 RepID=UPI003F7BCAE4
MSFGSTKSKSVPACPARNASVAVTPKAASKRKDKSPSLTVGQSQDSPYENPPRFLRPAEVAMLCGIGKSTLWRWLKVPELGFPQPTKLSTRITVWTMESIRQWQAARSRKSGT